MAVIADGISVIIHVLNHLISILYVEHEGTSLISDEPSLGRELRELQIEGGRTSTRDGSVKRKDFYVDRRLTV
jgi:hypothetical protein